MVHEKRDADWCPFFYRTEKKFCHEGTKTPRKSRAVSRPRSRRPEAKLRSRKEELGQLEVNCKNISGLKRLHQRGFKDFLSVIEALRETALFFAFL
jgi:hypothetical protein